MGGCTAAGESVGTARAFALENLKWQELDDMPTKRFDCSCVIVENTLFVGGGCTTALRLCNSLVALTVGQKGWTTVCSTTNYDCTLVSCRNRLVATGGMSSESLLRSRPSNLAEELKADRGSWLSYPLMMHNYWRHGACTTKAGKIVVAGGSGESNAENTEFIHSALIPSTS